MSDRKLSLLLRGRLLSEFLWVTVWQIVAAAAGLGGVALLTAMLDPREYGQLALGLTVATLSQQTIFAPLAVTVLRFFAPADENRLLQAYFSACLRLFIRAVGALLLVQIIGALALLVTGQSRWLPLLTAALISSLFLGAGHALGSMQMAARNRRLAAWHEALGTCARFGLALALLSVSGGGSVMAMVGFAAGAAVTLGSHLWFFRLRLYPRKSDGETKSEHEQQYLSSMQSYAWPFSLWGIFTWARLASDRWALQAFSSTRAVGIYAVVFQLGYYPILLASAFVLQLATPILFYSAGDATDDARVRGVRQLNRRLTVLAVIVTVVASLLAHLFHDEIFLLVQSEDYARASGLLGPMVLAAGLFGTAQLVGLIPQLTFRSRQLLLPNIVSGVVGVLLNCVGAYFFGIMGVVYANVIFSVAYLLWLLHLRREGSTRVGGSDFSAATRT